MKYSFHPEAEAEFNQAIDYYESCAEGLRYDFAVEVYSAMERILAYPKTWAILDGIALSDMRGTAFQINGRGQRSADFVVGQTINIESL